MSVNEIRDKGGPILEENAMETLKIEKMCNWDNLPNELKVMCIKRTDFKTRANLMLSNRHNKMLVESVKYHLSYVKFYGFPKRFNVPKSYKFVVKSRQEDYVSYKYEPRKLMDVLLNSNIDELDIEFCGRGSVVLPDELANHLLNEDRKFSVKSLRIGWSAWIYAIVEHCDEQLEQVTLDFDENDSNKNVKKFLRASQVIAAKRLTVYCEIWYSWINRFNNIITCLVACLNYQNIGKEIIFDCDDQMMWEIFCEIAKSITDFRHPTEKIIRLRLQKPAKQVWVCYFRKLQTLYFSVVAPGSDAPNFKEIEKKRAKERKEYKLKTSRRALF